MVERWGVASAGLSPTTAAERREAYFTALREGTLKFKEETGITADGRYAGYASTRASDMHNPITILKKLIGRGQSDFSKMGGDNFKNLPAGIRLASEIASLGGTGLFGRKTERVLSALEEGGSGDAITQGEKAQRATGSFLNKGSAASILRENLEAVKTNGKQTEAVARAINRMMMQMGSAHSEDEFSMDRLIAMTREKGGVFGEGRRAQMNTESIVRSLQTGEADHLANTFNLPNAQSTSGLGGYLEQYSATAASVAAEATGEMDITAGLEVEGQRRKDLAGYSKYDETSNMSETVKLLYGRHANKIGLQLTADERKELYEGITQANKDMFWKPGGKGEKDSGIFEGGVRGEQEIKAAAAYGITAEGAEAWKARFAQAHRQTKSAGKIGPVGSVSERLLEELEKAGVDRKAAKKAITTGKIDEKMSSTIMEAYRKRGGFGDSGPQSEMSGALDKLENIVNGLSGAFAGGAADMSEAAGGQATDSAGATKVFVVKPSGGK